MNFTKSCRPGKVSIPGRRTRVDVYITIKYRDGGLSLSGVEGPMASGECAGGAGQIILSVDTLAPGWTPEMVASLRRVWREHHFNNMRAGSPAQTAWLNRHGRELPYEDAVVALTEVGLNPDPSHIHGGKPYKYGTARLTSSVPDDVVGWLMALPDADRPNPWD